MATAVATAARMHNPWRRRLVILSMLGKEEKEEGDRRAEIVAEDLEAEIGAYCSASDANGTNISCQTLRQSAQLFLKTKRNYKGGFILLSYYIFLSYDIILYYYSISV